MRLNESSLRRLIKQKVMEELNMVAQNNGHANLEQKAGNGGV